MQMFHLELSTLQPLTLYRLMSYGGLFVNCHLLQRALHLTVGLAISSRSQFNTLFSRVIVEHNLGAH